MTINRRTLCSYTNDQYRFESCISAAWIKGTSGERMEKKDRVEGKRSLLKYKNNLKFILNPNSPTELALQQKGEPLSRNNKSTNKHFSINIQVCVWKSLCELFCIDTSSRRMFRDNKKVRADSQDQENQQNAPKAAGDVRTLCKIWCALCAVIKPDSTASAITLKSRFCAGHCRRCLITNLAVWYVNCCPRHRSTIFADGKFPSARLTID